MTGRSFRISPLLKGYFLGAVSGVLLYAAFPPLNLFLTGWFALVPLLFGLRGAGKKHAFLIGFSSFGVFFVLHIFWLVRVTVPGMVILVALLSVFGGLFALFASFVIKRSMDVLLLPFAWVLLEYLRGRLLTGFPWGSLALSQWNNLAMIQVADITGMWGVSFLMVTVSCAVFGLLDRFKKGLPALCVCLFLLAAVYGYGSLRLESKGFYLEEGPVVRLVQGNIPQNEKWDARYAEDIVSGYVELSLGPGGEKPDADMVIWPETAYPYLIDSVEMEHLGRIAQALGTDLIAGGVVRREGVYYNSALHFSSDGELKGSYDKLHLVPFGEYVPFENAIGFLREYIDKPIGDFQAGDAYSMLRLRTEKAGDHRSNGALVREIRWHDIGTLICVEDIFPYISRNFAREGADILVNMTNDAWFGRTAASWQHLTSSVLRAVETRRPVVRAANTGVTCFIDPMGEVYSVLKRDGKAVFVEGVVQDRVMLSRLDSFYVRHGEVFVVFCAVMLILVLGFEVWRSTRALPPRE